MIEDNHCLNVDEEHQGSHGESFDSTAV